MSFILDALKKSEAERQRQASPGVIEVSNVAPRPRFPIWALAIGVLLGVNLVVLIVFLTRGDRTPATAAKAPPERAATSAIAPSNPPQSTAPASAPTLPSAAGHAPSGANFSPMDAPVYAPEIPVPQEPAHTTLPEPKAASEPRLSSRAPISDPIGSHDNEETLPTLDEMNLSGQHSIPELHLDIHVYDANPASRFVFINMRKYREGATMQEGPTVEHITRAGVVLNYQGLRFVLPRQ